MDPTNFQTFGPVILQNILDFLSKLTENIFATRLFCNVYALNTYKLYQEKMAPIRNRMLTN